jgi:subtilisin family serine protease
MTLPRMVSNRLLPLFAVLFFGVSAASAQTSETPRPGLLGRIDRAITRHYIVQAEHSLDEAEQSELAASGCEIQRPLGNGRYLVRIRAAANLEGSQSLFRSIDQLTAERKINRSVYQAMARGPAYVRVNVVFHDDASFEAARELIGQVGGQADQALLTDFQIPRRIVARIPASTVETLAAAEEVYAVTAFVHKTWIDNATEAILSSVTPLYSAPYGLTGNGVVASVFDKGAADATHQEFGGRLSVHTKKATAAHATHVSGTIGASGPTASCPQCHAEAKGMAPAVTLHSFDIDDDPGVYENKQSDYPMYSILTDNNSWGYILGWDNQLQSGDWTWTGNEDFFGAYDVNTAALDHITRATGTLMVHSAGNDADNFGPRDAPYRHYHTDDTTGDVVTTVQWCISSDGSGTDCPAAPTCNQCEKIHHPPNGPWGSISLTASAKDVLSVGAVDSAEFLTSFSSRGPTKDGRVKPDVVAKGLGVFSTTPGNSYGNLSGTSMSSPVVTGVSALLIQQWRQTFSGANPAPVVLKTLIIEGADDLMTSPVDFTKSLKGPDYAFGFGMVNAKASVDLIRADAAAGSRIRIGSVSQGGSVEIPFTLSSPANVRVTLGWSDPEVLLTGDEIATTALVNDLDLKIIDPTGATNLPYVLDKTHPEKAATKGVNHVDNTEQAEIDAAAAGHYKIVVSGTAVDPKFSPQQYVLVSNVALTAPCVDMFEPNGTAATAFGNVASGQVINGKTCSAGDVDYFKFQVDRSGPATAQVIATDTALRLTLSAGSQSTVIDVPVGATRSVTLQAGIGTGAVITPAEYFVRIEPVGDIGANPSYTLTSTFGSSASRKRAAHH